MENYIFVVVQFPILSKLLDYYLCLKIAAEHLGMIICLLKVKILNDLSSSIDTGFEKSNSNLFYTQGKIAWSEQNFKI